ncbi:hypothetical protein BV372_28605 [Nostoc sp. T09]|uniref:hypothetical protein n=1 Tax=Nostoc sp. T09 TaxID=1932621 RepID=UPI000A39FF98|nr:hypothetical protein [Nostoc sp. T09]OUL24780.1 hypothetical protein BV372_28605 [Nostoc sp. T09]
MFPQASRAKPPVPAVLKVSQLLIFLLVISVNYPRASSAHTVKIAADVGGTLHIEPNDNPQAGNPTQAWFALIRKGGKAIALKECNCQLAVYAEPHTAKEPPLLEPPLKPVSAERYQATPGAEIIFPKPGTYLLRLSGKPTAGSSFKPFELKFNVTVASSSASISQESQNVNNSVVETQSQSLPLWAIAAAIFATLGIVLAVLQKRRRF